MSPAPAAADRLRRLLAILPWVAARGGATLDEIAERFGGTTGQIERDLELAACCGRPPYTPDTLVEVVIWDGFVTVDTRDAVARPLRLSAADGFRVLTAGRTLAEVPGGASAPLESALQKLEKVLGEGVAIELEQPPFLEALQEAAAGGHTLEIEYYSLWRDEVTRRRIDPHHVHLFEGRWYVEVHDHLSGEARRLRVSRIQHVETTDERFAPVAERAEIGSVFTPGPDTHEVVLRLPPSARWVVETYPVLEAQEIGDGWQEVTLAVAGRPWLERLLLRVGADASVVAPDELAGAGADAARRVLARYR